MWYHHISYIQFQLYPSDLRWWYLGFSSVPFGMAEAKGFWGCHPQLPDMTWGCELNHIRWHETPIYPWQLWPWQFIWCGYDVNMTWICFFFHTLINYHIHHIHSMNMDDHQIWTNPVFHLMIEIMIPKFLDELGQKFQHFFSWTSAERGLDPNRCLADPLALWSAGTRTKRPQKAKASVSLRSIESIQNTS